MIEFPFNPFKVLVGMAGPARTPELESRVNVLYL